MIRNYNDLAIFLIASWRLGNPNRRIPTSGGILDAALEKLLPELPQELSKLLHFGNTRIGRRCYELERILTLARDSELITDPNPSYKESEIKISEGAAARWSKRLAYDPEIVRSLGSKMGHLAEQVASSQQDAA